MDSWTGIGHILERLFGLTFIKWITRLVFTIQVWRRRKQLADLSGAMNVLLFTELGGIRDLLAAYRADKSRANWQSLTRRADENRAKLNELQSVVDEVKTRALLGEHPEVLNLLDDMLRAKRFWLYDQLADLRAARSTRKRWSSTRRSSTTT